MIAFKSIITIYIQKLEEKKRKCESKKRKIKSIIYEKRTQEKSNILSRNLVYLKIGMCGF